MKAQHSSENIGLYNQYRHVKKNNSSSSKRQYEENIATESVYDTKIYRYINSKKYIISKKKRIRVAYMYPTQNKIP